MKLFKALDKHLEEYILVLLISLTVIIIFLQVVIGMFLVILFHGRRNWPDICLYG